MKNDHLQRVNKFSYKPYKKINCELACVLEPGNKFPTSQIVLFLKYA